MLQASGGCPGVPMTPVNPIQLLRGCFWVPLGLHMAAQRLHMAAHGIYMAAHSLLLGAIGDAYGCSEAAFGCRGVAFCCTGAVYGSHAADMQYMLRLAGPGWAARILGIWPDGGSWPVWGP